MNFEGRAQRQLFVSASVVPSESVEQQRLFQWLRLTARLYPEGSEMRETLHWIHSIPNGAHLSGRQAAKMVAEGLTKGILDISTDEARQGFHGLRIEMKRKGGRISPEQRDYMKYLKRIGIRTEVCYCWRGAARVLIDYLDLTEYDPI